jgi:hypothetical protein
MASLTANRLRGLLGPARQQDGDGMFLNVKPSGTRS